MTSQQDKLRVYLACRPIFIGENAQLRKGKKVRQLVRQKRSSLGPLFQTMKEKKIFDIVQSLLERRVFESDLIAKVEFPDLFRPSPSRDAHRQASGFEAAQSITKALDEATSEEWDLDEAASQCSDGPGAEQGDVTKERGAEPRAAIGSGLPIDDKGQPIVPEKSDEAIVKGQLSVPDERDKGIEADHSYIPPSKPSLVGKLPPFYPCYLPYKTQHSILTTAQQSLEECCFSFATRNMPSILDKEGWDCPEAVELTKWLRTFRKKSVATYVKPFFASIEAEDLGDLISNLARLRHSAVHRLPVTAKGVNQLLGSAVKLSQLLQDYQRAAQLEDVRKKLESKIRAIELHKAVLEDTATAGLLDIQRQRDELDRREKALVEETAEEDRQNNAFIGNLLEEHVLGTFGKGKRVWAPHGLGERGVDYQAERERIEQSLRVDHEAGVNGVAEKYGVDGDYYYDSLEEITAGTWLDEAD